MMCSIAFPNNLMYDLEGIDTLQSKLQCSVLVKFLILLFPRSTTIFRCWARMRGHGSSSVMLLLEIAMYDSEDRFADSSNTRGSMNEIMFLLKVSALS